MELAALIVALSSSEPGRAFTLDGRQAEGRLRVASGRASAGELRFPVERLFYARLGKSPARKGLLEGVVLAGGDLLEGRIVEMREGTVRLKTRVFGELTLPRGELRVVAFSGDYPPRGGSVAAGQRAAPGEDEVHLVNGDVLRGSVEWISESKLAIRTKFGLSAVKREVLKVVVFAGAAPGKRSGFGVGLKGGERLSGEILGLDDSALTIRTPYAKIRLPERQIAYIRTLSESVEWLSNKDPAEIKEYGEFDAVFHYTRDAAMLGGMLSVGGWAFEKGLSCHSYCELVYELDRAHESFLFFAGLDDELASKGSVGMRVELDGVRAWEKSFSGPGREFVRVGLRGAKKLKLVVDFGPDGHDACDHADWACAALVRR